MLRFCGLMHPDVQTIIPTGIVIRYFLDACQPLGTRPALATAVTYRDWTWEVTGVSYPQTAEVSFRQDFVDGPIEGVVHLVRLDDRWAWFFGRNRNWIAQQSRRLGGNRPSN